MKALRGRSKSGDRDILPTKRIVLEIDDGNFATGFPVTVEISEAGRAPHKILHGQLPPAPGIPRLYQQWQSLYRKLPGRIIVPDAQVTNQSVVGDCRRAADALENAVIRWLGYAPVLRLQMEFQQAVSRGESAQLILQTDDVQLRRLPWHLWEMFDQYPNLGLALHSSYPPEVADSVAMQSPVQVLAVLGNSEALDVQRDRQILEQLPNADITLLDKPSRQLLNEKLWERPWDILFFAGHSASQADAQDGEVQINDTEALSLSELEYALQQAVRKGLKLAIFNSCDGLGLAQGLVNLKIPYTVVMREPVADSVAQTFLRYFLESFSQGQPLHLALRIAREKLQGIEATFPCASWLPVICQHPSAPVLQWPQSSNGAITAKQAGVSVAGLGLLVGIGAAALLAMNGVRDEPTPGREPGLTSGAKVVEPIHLAPPVQLGDSSSSLGNRILITNTGTLATKQQAVQAFGMGDYGGAIAFFQSTLDYAPNDPESRIYLNNAKAALAAKQSNRPILRVATSVPIGGNLNIAQEMLRGIAQAQADYNQATEKGKDKQQPMLQVQIANDDNSPALGRQIAERHVQDSSILAVIGHNASEVTLAAGEIYHREKLVMVTPTSGAAEVSDLGSYVFRTVPSVRADARHLASYAIKKSGKRRFALCNDSKSPYSMTFNQEFRQAVEWNNGQVSSVPCDFSSESFNSGKFVSNAVADGVDALLLNPSVERISQATNLAKKATGRMALFSGSTMATFETLDQGKEAVNGMVLSVAWHPQVAQDPAFIQQARQLWGGNVNWRTALAYDATQAVLAGLEQAQDREGLQRVLADEAFVAEGATGEIRFQQSGDRRPSSAIGLLIQVQSAAAGGDTGGNGYRFVPLQDSD